MSAAENRRLIGGLPQAPDFIADSQPILRGDRRERKSREAKITDQNRREADTLYNLWIESYRESVRPQSVVVGRGERRQELLVDFATVHGKRAILEAGRITDGLSIQGEKGSRKGDTGPNNLNIATAIVGEVGGRISMGGYATIHGRLADGTMITVNGDENYVNDPNGLNPLVPGTYVIEDGQLKSFAEVLRLIPLRNGAVISSGALEYSEDPQAYFARKDAERRLKEQELQAELNLIKPVDPFVLETEESTSSQPQRRGLPSLEKIHKTHDDGSKALNLDLTFGYAE